MPKATLPASVKTGTQTQVTAFLISYVIREPLQNSGDSDGLRGQETLKRRTEEGRGE